MTVETAFATFPVLTTGRFVLRQICSMDAPDLFDIFSKPEVVKFGGTPLFSSLNDAEAYTQRVQQGYEMSQYLRWGITYQSSDTVIGTCGFHHFGPGFHYVELGYNLHPAHWGQGIMTEVVSVVVDYGFRDLGLHRIEAVVDDANTRSRKLLLNLGFQYEGNLRQRYWIGDTFEDEHYYGLLNSEWLSAHPSTPVEAK